MLSIVICTYNRSEILQFCLDSILKYANIHFNQLEVIVIDNNSSDNTSQIVEKYLSLIPLRYIFEGRQGLSIARNRGVEEASYDWIFYLDDDGIIMEDTIYYIFSIIHSREYLLFGGIYLPYYSDKKPDWLPKDFGTKKISENRNENDRISGGVMVCHKSIFIKVGLFNDRLGMSGSNIGYAEESDLQNRYEEIGGRVHLFESVKILHLVGKHKFKVLWHLKDAYVKGRDDIKRHKVNYLKQIFVMLPINSIKNIGCLMNKDYYIQNFVIDTLQDPLYMIGRMVSYLNKRDV